METLKTSLVCVCVCFPLFQSFLTERERERERGEREERERESGREEEERDAIRYDDEKRSTGVFISDIIIISYYRNWTRIELQ